MAFFGAVLGMLGLLAGAVNAAAETSARPGLRVASRAPLAISGTRFQPGERVSVVVFAPRRAKRIVHASGTGAFTARFDFPLGRCGRLSAHAVGARGSRARLLPTGIRPNCGPPEPAPLSIGVPVGVGKR